MLSQIIKIQYYVHTSCMHGNKCYITEMSLLNNALLKLVVCHLTHGLHLLIVRCVYKLLILSTLL